VTQDPRRGLPADIDRMLAGHWQVSNALDPESLLAGVRGVAGQMGGIDRLLGTLEQLQVPLGWVRDRLGLGGLGEQAAMNFRDKSRMKTVLRAAGVPCARHRLATSVDEALAFVATVGYPVVGKPPDGAGSKATYRIETEAQLRDVLQGIPPSPEKPYMFEEFMTGEEHSFDAVNIGSETVWHSLTHYSPTPLHVMETPWIQWTVLLPREIDHPRYDEIRRVGKQALKALGMGTGLSHMEWFRRPDGSVAVSEVGARPPGSQICSLIGYANDIDFYAAWARLVTTDQFTKPERKFAVGCAYLRGQGTGRVSRVEGVEDAKRDLGHLIVEAKLPQIGQAPSGTYDGEGYVILKHPSTEVVERALKRLVGLVRVELS
jgi:D-alanine-D-alanine ligase-like ATP-grasp enzyme